MFHVKHLFIIIFGHKIMFHVKHLNPIYCKKYRETFLYLGVKHNEIIRKTLFTCKYMILNTSYKQSLELCFYRENDIIERSSVLNNNIIKIRFNVPGQFNIIPNKRGLQLCLKKWLIFLKID